jgi:tRNA nucleotidyltransferase/poly(A) polymerase
MPPATANRNDALAVLRHLRDAGHTAYFAGGCVRDLLLGLTPKDYDVATDATPDRVRQIFPDTQAVGAAFGVILVRRGRSVIEVATFRSDGKYTDGRRPDAVRFSTPEADAARRDFTINGLFLDPVEDRVIDFVGGRADLDARIVRAIGNPAERFAEDHLRLLRAVRFTARLDFDLDPATRAAVIAHARHLPRISPERIGEELRRILIGRHAAVGWRWLWELSLAPVVFRFLPATGDGGFDPARSLMSSSIPPASVGYGLAVAALDYLWHRAVRPADVRPMLDRPTVLKIFHGLRQGLKISNDESTEVEGILTGVSKMLAEPPAGIAGMKRFLATPTSHGARALLDALAVCGVHQSRIETVQQKLAELALTEVAPPPLVTGDDLTSAGAAPGPRFKLALDSAYDAQLEGTVSDRDAAMAIAMGCVRSENHGG